MSGSVSARKSAAYQFFSFNANLPAWVNLFIALSPKGVVY